MEKSNNWIDESFKSVQHQKQPRLNPDLFSKIEKRIESTESKVIFMPIWKVSVAAAVIISANVFTFRNVIHNEKPIEVVEYQLGTHYNFYVNE